MKINETNKAREMSRVKKIQFKRFKKIKRAIEKNAWLESLLYVVLGIIVAFAVYKGLGLALTTSEPIVTVMSNSMVPTLHKGDLVVLSGIEKEDIVTAKELCGGNTTDLACRQDATIVVYWSPKQNKLIIHRVWSLEDGTLTTWGDAMPFPDGDLVSWNAVRGQTILRVPYLGWPRVWLGGLIGR